MQSALPKAKDDTITFATMLVRTTYPIKYATSGVRQCMQGVSA